MSNAVMLSLALLLTSTAVAQRTYEDGGNVLYQDAAGAKTVLGPGFSPVLANDGKVLFIRGTARLEDRSACLVPSAKNRVVRYDPLTRSESILYDKPLPNEFVNGEHACIYRSIDVSPSGKTIYIQTPWAVTSNRLMIIDLQSGKVRHVDQIIEVHVIRTGRFKGGLLYSARRTHEPEAADPTAHAYYPFFHANPQGRPIKTITVQPYEDGEKQLTRYLQAIGGRIYYYGNWLP